MGNPKFDENLQLIYDGVACQNDRPISCYSGSAAGAVMMGMTVAEFIEEPVKGAKASIEMLRKLQEDAGPLHALNSTAGSMNMVVAITKLWNAKVLVPGKDLPANSFWQVKEEKLIDISAYDEILKEGYSNFLSRKVLPRVIDREYAEKYAKIAKEGAEEIWQAYAALGVPIMEYGALAAMIPFEQLCGMRSMTQFFMDCYKMPDKIKELSDFIFAETSAQTEDAINARKGSPRLIGDWIGGWRTAGAMVNPKIWDNLVWPYMKASAEQLLRHHLIPILHLDQNWNRDIERFAELPAEKIVLNTDGMTDLPRTRKLLPGYALMGDVPASLLTTGTSEQVREYVNRLIDEVGPGGLFVCAGCDTPVTAKYENLVAMVKATNEWR